MTLTNEKSPFAFLKKHDLPTWLFLGALIVYLVTRLIGLDRFPIYFFTDEANQTQSIATLAKNNYRLDGDFLPAYFPNGPYLNLGLSVYLQWLPYVVFGKSAVITRMTSVLITLIAAISIGIILRDIFKLKHWWLGTLFLSITPAWFLHSRTAFETAEFVAFYTGALCSYLFYRFRSPRYLYIALFLAACAFYSYSPAQLIVPLTVIALMLSDWDYHSENRRTVLYGRAFAFLLSLPYLRFIIFNLFVPFMHLKALGSYWTANTSFLGKVEHYVSEYMLGLSPWYWYVPHVRDLSRHLMKDYGHIMLATLPFMIIGFVSMLRNLHLSANRTILIVILVSPSAAALVEINITRSLLFVIPASILTAIGFEKTIEWIKAPRLCFQELANGAGLNRKRIAIGLLIFAAGAALGFMTQTGLDRTIFWVIFLFLSVQISGLDVQIAKWVVRMQKPREIRPSSYRQTIIAVFMFVILSGTNILMLCDALYNGPIWFRDYGLYGMQYGAFQIFDAVKQYKQEHPDTRVIFTPYWTNGFDVLAYFFMGTPLPIEIGSVLDLTDNELPFDDTMVFVTTPQEYQAVVANRKFTDLRTEKIVPYPDGTPGFYFIHMSSYRP
jgi:4-amino-4-deoxy-L-arabinose transferase-like glycosyltransferase